MAVKEKAISKGAPKGGSKAAGSASIVSELLKAKPYKRNQGRTVRLVTALTIGLIIALSAWRLHQTLKTSPAMSYRVATITAEMAEGADAANVSKALASAIAGFGSGGSSEVNGPAVEYSMRLDSEAVPADVKAAAEGVSGVSKVGVSTSSRSSWAVFGIPFALLAVGSWLSYRTVHIPKFAEFLIAVEAEMSKVSWPTRTELIRSSIVVIVFIIALAAILFVFDLIWRKVFELIGVI